MTSHDETKKLHQIHLQLSSEDLLELHTWLHDIDGCLAVNALREIILATILTNLDSGKTPCATVDLVIPTTLNLKEQESSWDNEGGRPVNPDVLSAAAMQDDEDEHEENAAETAELDESDTRALLDELKKGC